MTLNYFMYSSSKNFDNVNDGDANSKYDILNSFYKNKNNLYSKLKKYYCDIFDEDYFNSMADKKEKELMNILELRKVDPHLSFYKNNLSNKSSSVRIKQYLRYVALKNYSDMFESYKRIEYFYNIVIISKILLNREKKKNKIRFFYKKQSINCLKSLKAGLFLPFEYDESMLMFGKLFLFIFLSLPAFAGGIILFLVSIILLLPYSIKSALDESKKILKRVVRKKPIKKMFKYFVCAPLKLFGKLNIVFAAIISKIGDVFYVFLSSFQFSLLRKSANRNKTYKIKRKNKKIGKNLDALVEKNNKTGFQKSVEEEFDKIIYYLISTSTDSNISCDNIIKLEEFA